MWPVVADNVTSHPATMAALQAVDSSDSFVARRAERSGSGMAPCATAVMTPSDTVRSM